VATIGLADAVFLGGARFERIKISFCNLGFPLSIFLARLIR
jgi:hypothetical protein